MFELNWRVFNSCIYIYLLTHEIVKTTKKIAWLMYHLERCKKVNDKIKLTLMIMISVAYVASLIQLIKKEIELSIDLLLPKKVNYFLEKPQKLISCK